MHYLYQGLEKRGERGKGALWSFDEQPDLFFVFFTFLFLPCLVVKMFGLYLSSTTSSDAFLYIHPCFTALLTSQKLVSAVVVEKHILPQRLNQPYAAFCVNVKKTKNKLGKPQSPDKGSKRMKRVILCIFYRQWMIISFRLNVLFYFTECPVN